MPQRTGKGAPTQKMQSSQKRPMSRPRRMIAALLVFLVVAAVAAGLVSGALPAAGRNTLYATGLWVDGGAATVPPGSFDTPARASPSTESTSADPTSASSPVLPAAMPSAAPDARSLTALVASVQDKEVKGRFSGTVVDVGSGKALYRHNSTTPYIPASITKLLTSMAALEVLGPEHRFHTQVVQPAAGHLILVGGGDPYLSKKSDTSVYPARASIAELAVATAKELKQAKRPTVTVGYDASKFSGPAWNSHWPDTYRDQVTPVSALWVDEGRLSGYSPGPREQDPSKAAATAFAAALKANDINVSSVKPAGTGKITTGKGAQLVAEVESMPLARIVQQVLLHSDNDGAEVLARQVAIGLGKPGSAVEASKAVQAACAKLGVWGPGTKVVDGSGLSRDTAISSDTLVKALRYALADDHAGFRSLITGLPVAGVDGSLKMRFSETGATAGRGQVRAKTGTLTKVHSLAGYVRTRDGALLAFSFIVNDAKNGFAARVWLDRVTAALASCGCR